MKRKGTIMVFEPSDPSLGPEVTYATETSRKSFRLPAPRKNNRPWPLSRLLKTPRGMPS